MSWIWEVSIGPDGVLRVAYYIEHSAHAQASSLVYRLSWDQQAFEPDIVLPGQVVVNLESSPDSSSSYSLYALSRLGKPQDLHDASDGGRRTGVVSTWTNGHPEHLEQLRTFDDRLLLEGLSVGRNGLLLIYATNPNMESGGAPIDLTFTSTDAGKTWKQADDKPAQGGYFDPETNTLYSLFAYTLKKRKF